MLRDEVEWRVMPTGWYAPAIMRNLSVSIILEDIACGKLPAEQSQRWFCIVEYARSCGTALALAHARGEFVAPNGCEEAVVRDLPEETNSGRAD